MVNPLRFPMRFNEGRRFSPGMSPFFPVGRPFPPGMGPFRIRIENAFVDVNNLTRLESIPII
ncbi:hypothetical protein B1B04_25075 [Lysinibacillus sp. KCTC 33748]|nr:hypothetical protein B1B04_25075 [Lysinibacillus sp. KCTC 33748]SKC19843.1 hypothetical protein SAMN06295926_1481 [Lysinibacillus sp. AC-3]